MKFDLETGKDGRGKHHLWLLLEGEFKSRVPVASGDSSQVNAAKATVEEVLRLLKILNVVQSGEAKQGELV